MNLPKVADLTAALPMCYYGADPWLKLHIIMHIELNMFLGFDPNHNSGKIQKAKPYAN